MPGPRPLSRDGADVRAEHPLDYLGQDGGAGLGSGPGMAVGAVLALAGTDRPPVAVPPRSRDRREPGLDAGVDGG
jgi:hypothetical protein